MRTRASPRIARPPSRASSGLGTNRSPSRRTRPRALSVASSRETVLLCRPSSEASSETPRSGRPSLNAPRIASALSADCTLRILQPRSAFCNSAANALVLRVVQDVRRRLRRDELSEDIDRDLRAVVECHREVREADVAANREPVCGAAKPAGHLTVGVHGLAAVHRRVALVPDHERAEPPRRSVARGLESWTAVELRL